MGMNRKYDEILRLIYEDENEVWLRNKINLAGKMNEK